MSVNPLVEAVKAHALKNYENGWDVIVECWEDEDIEEKLRDVVTEADAIRVMNAIVNLWREQEDNVMSQSGEYDKCPRCKSWIYVDDADLHQEECK